MPPGGKPMKRIAFAAAMSAVLMASTASLTQTPSWAVPPESARCPSKWGVGDERGSGNLMKPQVVLDAIKMITFMNPQSNERGSNEEMVLSEIGQVGTQLDGF